MGTTSDARNVAGPRPLAVAILSEQGVLPMNHDPSGSSRLALPLCPAYRFCRESRGPCSYPVLDHDAQITTLHNLLKAIKEAALRLVQLITIDIEERRRKDADPSTQSLNLRGERHEQVCALCGVALNLRASSEKSNHFAVDREIISDYISSGQFDDIFLKIVQNSSDLSFDKSLLNYVLSEKNNNNDKHMKREDKISSETQSSENSTLKSKLIFIRQISSNISSPSPKFFIKREYMTSSHQCVVDMSSTISFMQDSSTITQDFCPCACGLFVKDETEVSIDSASISKDTPIKTKLEKLDLNLETEIVRTKVRDNAGRIRNIETQNLEKDTTVKDRTEEVVQLRLQMQIEKLHRNIEFFKRENEYIRCLAEKCRSLSEDMTDLHQLLPNEDEYFGVKLHLEHAIHDNDSSLANEILLRRRNNGHINRDISRFEHTGDRHEAVSVDFRTMDSGYKYFMDGNKFNRTPYRKS